MLRMTVAADQVTMICRELRENGERIQDIRYADGKAVITYYNGDGCR